MNIKEQYVDELILGANARIHADPGGSDLRTGLIYGANENRFESSSYRGPLTTFLSGAYDRDPLAEQLEFIAPTVPVPQRRFEYKKSTNLEIFNVETNNDDIRAVGADFKPLEYSDYTAFGKTDNKGLIIRVDRDNVPNDAWRQIYTQRLMQRLLRNELIRAYTLLLATATNNAVTWYPTDADTSNPDRDLRNACVSALEDGGIYPNRCVFGLTAWNGRKDAYQNPENNNYGGGYLAASNDEARVAADAGLEDLMVFRSIYQSSATAKSLIAGLSAVVFNAKPGLSADDPSTLKRFVSPTEGGTPFRVYIEEKGKFTDIMVEHYCSTLACFLQSVQKLTVTLD